MYCAIQLYGLYCISQLCRTVKCVYTKSFMHFALPAQILSVGSNRVTPSIFGLFWPFWTFSKGCDIALDLIIVNARMRICTLCLHHIAIAQCVQIQFKVASEFLSTNHFNHGQIIVKRCLFDTVSLGRDSFLPLR